METALIGLPQCGKTTIFNALSGQQAALAGSYQQVHLADVPVLDRRVDRLAALFEKKDKIYPSVHLKDLHLQLTDRGGIAAATIAELRTSDAITVVLRAFLSEALPPDADPAGDFRKILDSLIFSDYEIAEKRLERLEKEGKKGEREHATLSRISQKLGAGQPIGTELIHEEERTMLAGFQFLTAKPLLVAVNMGEASVDVSRLEEQARALGIRVFPIQGEQEMEIARLSEEDQEEFLADLGLSEAARLRFVQALYESLDLISFLTIGDREVRAWSLAKGSTALKAAGKIHSDMERGFIRAEVIAWERLLALGGFSEARKHGELRLEGKEYVVQDGDVLTIRFNL